MGIRCPKVSDFLYCACCGSKCNRIDADWIDWFLGLPEKNKGNLYSIEDDIFFTYDGCEELI